MHRHLIYPVPIATHQVVGRGIIFLFMGENLAFCAIDAEGQGQNKTFTSKGKQQTVHKVVNKKPVTAVKLTPKDGEAPMYFVIVNDTTLRLVNDSLQEAVSDLNYDIIKVKQ